jgi:hypothetical protein
MLRLARQYRVDREREGEAYLRFQTSVCRSASSSGQGARVAVREEQAGVEMGCLGGAGVRRRGDAKNVRGVGLRARGERGGGVGGHPVQCIPTPVLFANERREGWCSGAARVGLHCFSERADGRGGRKRVSPCCCDANVNARARVVRDGTGGASAGVEMGCLGGAGLAAPTAKNVPGVRLPRRIALIGTWSVRKSPARVD